MIKQVINQIRLWARIITILYPVNFYIFFIRVLLAVHIRGLDNFTLPIIVGLYLFLPIAFDAQKRWILWAWHTVRQFSTAQRIAAIALVTASLSLNFVDMNALSIDAFVIYVAIGYVSAFWGIGREE